MKCTDLLMQEHKVILRCLYVLEEMGCCIEKGKYVAQDDVNSVIAFLREFADEHHQTMEESALFPELMRTSAAQEPALRHMLFEHDQERSLVEALQDALLTKKGMDFVHFACRLVDLLRNHIRKEDTILFQIVERHLLPEQDEKISAEFAKFQVSERFLIKLRELEWEYLRKVA
jgi:hemerythrin-like domain-containing protein